MSISIFPATTSGGRLGLGGAALGNLYTAISDGEATAVVRAALDDGCRSFDTAPHYGNGLSEHRIGCALRGNPAQARLLSTKVGRILRADPSAPHEQNGYMDVLPFVQHWDYSAPGVRRSIEDSCQRLGVARIDVAFIHDCDAITHGKRYPAVLRQVVREAIPELQRMKVEGIIGHYGLGVNDVDVCLDVLREADIDCLLLAGRYSLLDQSALPALLPQCIERGVRIAVGGVFNSGILATGVRDADKPLRFNYQTAPTRWIERTAVIEAACERFKVPLRAAAMQFPLGCPAVDIVLAGPQTVAHWHDAVATMAWPIPSAFWRHLHEAGLLAADAPTPR